MKTLSKHLILKRIIPEFCHYLTSSLTLLLVWKCRFFSCRRLGFQYWEAITGISKLYSIAPIHLMSASTANLTGPSILKISSQLPVLICDKHNKEIADVGEAIKHLRAKHVGFIGRPGRLEEMDTHGHCWYCFDCGSLLKDHRSFNSDDAMWSHLKDRHSNIMGEYPGLLWS